MVVENNNKISRRVGSTGSDMYTPSFDGKDNPSIITLPDAPSKSFFYQIPLSSGFLTHADEIKISGLRALDFISDYTVIGDDAYYRSASNLYKFSREDIKKWGNAYHPEDRGFEGWKLAGEKDMTVSYHEPEKEIKWLAQSPEKVADFSPKNTQLKKYITSDDYNGPISKYGVALSMLQNRIQDVRNILFDSDHRTTYDRVTEDFFEFLNEKPDAIKRTVSSLGIENRGPGYSARLYYDNKESMLMFHTGFYEQAKTEAEALGLKGREAVEYITRATLYHELDHNSQPHMPERNAETEVGEDLYKFFSGKAKGLAGTKEEKVYLALASAEKAYAQMFREGKPHSKSRNLESKLQELEDKARSMGLNHDETLDYVARNLGGAVEEEIEENDLETRISERTEYKKTYNTEYNDLPDEYIETADIEDAGGESDTHSDSE